MHKLHSKKFLDLEIRYDLTNGHVSFVTVEGESHIQIDGLLSIWSPNSRYTLNKKYIMQANITDELQRFCLNIMKPLTTTIVLFHPI